MGWIFEGTGGGCSTAVGVAVRATTREQVALMDEMLLPSWLVSAAPPAPVLACPCSPLAQRSSLGGPAACRLTQVRATGGATEGAARVWLA